MGRAHDLVAERLRVPLGIHRDERGELQKAGIDHAPHTLRADADALDHQLLELAHGHAGAEIGHVGGGGIGVDRAADERERARLRVGVDLGEIGGGRERQRRGLADRDHVGVGSQLLMNSTR